MAEDSAASSTWPPKSTAVFVAHAKVHINAPASKVYELLTSPSTWPDWNIFVPTAHLLSRKSADGKTEPYIYDSSYVGEAKYRSTPQFQVGDTIRYNVEMPTSGKGPSAKRTKNTSDEVIAELTVPESGDQKKGAVYRATWTVAEKFGMPTGVRINEIEVLGDGECEYRTCEELSGIMAYVVKFAVGKAVQTGLEEWAEGLKSEAEKRSGLQDA